MKITSHRLTGTNVDARGGETIVMLGAQVARLKDEDAMWKVAETFARTGAWSVLAYEYVNERYGFCVRAELVRWDG